MQPKNSNNGKRLVFSEESYDKINRTLQELAKRLPAQLCVFADKNGYVISYFGLDSEIDLTSLTALSAGAFSATVEIASQIGESDQFKFINHEGQKNNLYLSSISDHYMMIIVCDKSVAAGMVRVLTHHAIQRIESLIAELKLENKKAMQYIDVEFGSLLTSELNRTFGL